MFGKSKFYLNFSEKLIIEAINADLSILIYHKRQSMIVDGLSSNILIFEMSIVVHFAAKFKVIVER